MAGVFTQHKKACITIGIILAVGLFALYLYALFLPGVWHGDAFLYQQDDGSFIGSDLYADYKMRIEHTNDGTDISFSVNDTVKKYDVIYDLEDKTQSVKVLENGNEIFNGTAVGEKDNYILIDEKNSSSDMISVRVGNKAPSEEELFPGYTKLYNLSVAEKYNTRGNPYMLFLILLFAAILFLDIKFPDLFWILEHRLEVDGGEPSDWYRFGQKVGYVLIPIGILVCIILTFTIH